MIIKAFREKTDLKRDWMYTDDCGVDRYLACGDGLAEFFRVPNNVEEIVIKTFARPGPDRVKLDNARDCGFCYSVDVDGEFRNVHYVLYHLVRQMKACYVGISY